MNVIEIGELKKKINELEWQIVRLKAGHAAISEVCCKAIVESEKDTQRLDWLDKNMTSLDSVQTFGKEVPVGELRQYVDAAIQKEEQP